MITTHGPMTAVKTSIGGHSVGGFAVKWIRVKKTKKETLAALNKKLFADPQGLLAWGEENTRRLTGRPRI